MNSNMMHLLSSIKTENDISELKELVNKLQKEIGNNKSQIEKIKWLGKPEQFGFIFLELVKKGYIELPSSKGQGSYSKLAKIFSECFDINTTPENLKRVLNPESNQLSNGIRSKFTIPHINEIS